jgi:hypothetical protein
MVAKLADLERAVSWWSIVDEGKQDEPDNHRRKAESLYLRDQTPQHREDMSLPHRRR